MKRINSSNGTSMFTFYEGEKIEVRPNSQEGVLCTVYKPGMCNYDGLRNYASPMITWGQNSTKHYTWTELYAFLYDIKEAMTILGIDPSFQITGLVPKPKKVKNKPTCIPTKNISKYAVYAQENGAKYIFLHKGLCLWYDKRTGDRQRENRLGCNYVYLEVTDDVNCCNGVLRFNTWGMVDTTKNTRKFVEKVCDIEKWGTIEWFRQGALKELILLDCLV